MFFEMEPLNHVSFEQNFAKQDLNTHRIHGAAIYGNMDPIHIPPSC